MSMPNIYVGIVTGFFIRNAVPPSPGTDGLGGMAHLATALSNLGIPVTVISDAPCCKAVWAVTTELPKDVAFEITSVSAASVKSLRALSEAERPITHIIAIERVSPASNGKPHGEYGAGMSDDTTPLHPIFRVPLTRAPSWAASLPRQLHTPCDIVSERGIVNNLHATARGVGSKTISPDKPLAERFR